ncbi:unnamed protein product [Ectocarpus sp. 6 AP-2014]|uniref:Cysteine-rich PDZ-binding protein n=1 Tax=Ectocarpus siliculosus TaxID=2880 RepID=D7FN66_ECTSI|nr:conserved unknown protein [Ectocarpus siliculosus]|eukprot:CBJ30127.1 conserved unknown protein [Ectocarpus siliculosus]
MVCEKCETKLSKVIVPDKWKDGARNTTGGDSGGRRVGHENMLLKHGAAKRRNNRFTPLTRVCRICKTKVNQDHHYCQECAFSKGICGMCGRKTDDITNQRRTAK